MATATVVVGNPVIMPLIYATEISTTSIVAARIVPGLPNTGIAPEGDNYYSIVLLIYKYIFGIIY